MRNINPQTPSKFTGLKITEPKNIAAGIPAVISAIRFAREEMGLLRGLNILSKVNQQDGFDCPGCAWPEPENRSSIAEYCENGAKAVAEEATKKIVDADFFRDHSVEELSTWSDLRIGKSGRLTQPMILEPGEIHYKPVIWDQAFERIGIGFKALDDPNQAIFYTSGRTSNEAAFMYQLFVRKFGTNNLPDCSNMCHESSSTALTEVLGIGKGSVTLDDFEKAEVIIILGQNPGTNHPRMLSALQKAKRNNCKIININPIPEAGMGYFKNPQELSGWIGKGTKLADLYLPVRINGDVAILKAISKRLLEEDSINVEFIQQRTEGFDEFKEAIQRVSLEECLEDSGITAPLLEEAIDMLKPADKIICCWAMGLTQHKNAIANIQEIVNLLLLKGSIGKAGAGTCPVRGHSNVQGDRTMGIWEVAVPAFMQKLEEVFGFVPPKEKGYNTVEAIKAMHAGKAKVFVSMGGNFLSATPDTEFTAEALQNVDLSVHVSTKLNRSHLVTGKTSIILPCLARSEKDIQHSGQQYVTMENSMGVVHTSKGHLKPISAELKSEPVIIAGMAKSILEDNGIPWNEMIEDYSRVRDLIERCIPGFENYNTRVTQPDGFYLPNANREGRFSTDTGKAKFTRHELPKHELKDDEFMMMTIRSHDQYNTTIYGLNDRYRGIHNERRVVFVNKNDMKDAGLSKGQIVYLESNYKGQKRTATNFKVVPYQIPSRCVATYFPEANVLVPIDLFADKSNTPVSKSVIIKIKTEL